MSKRAVPNFPQRLLNFLARIHNERTIAGDRLAQGFAGHQEKPHRTFAGVYVDGVTVLPHHKPRFGNNGLVLSTESSFAVENIGERRVSPRYRLDKSCVRCN